MVHTSGNPESRGKGKPVWMLQYKEWAGTFDTKKDAITANTMIQAESNQKKKVKLKRFNNIKNFKYFFKNKKVKELR